MKRTIIINEDNFWEKITDTDKIIKYINKNFDFINIEILNPNNYQTRNNYQVKFNKYIIGIFKTKNQTFRFIKKWIIKHT